CPRPGRGAARRPCRVGARPRRRSSPAVPTGCRRRRSHGSSPPCSRRCRAAVRRHPRPGGEAASRRTGDRAPAAAPWGPPRCGGASWFPSHPPAPRTGASVADDEARPIVLEREAHLAQPLPCHRLAERCLVLGVEEQKAAASGPDELAADGARLAPCLVPAVDRVARHPLGPAALVLPVLVEQLAAAATLALLSR